MRLGYFQGTSMTMKYAHKTYDPTTLSNAEKIY